MTVSRPRRASRRKRRVFRRFILWVLLLALAGVGALYGADLLEGARYKLEYRDLIERYSAEQSLDPALVASMIYNESRFNPSAVSRIGARGLMQIMPETGEWLAGKFGEAADYAPDRLFDANTNLRYGCWYLGFLMRRYDGDMRCSSSAYHAGQGTVDKWLADPNYSSDGKTLDVIGYDSTNTYVNRVLRYYEKYEEIYAS